MITKAGIAAAFVGPNVVSEPVPGFVLRYPYLNGRSKTAPLRAKAFPSFFVISICGSKSGVAAKNLKVGGADYNTELFRFRRVGTFISACRSPDEHSTINGQSIGSPSGVGDGTVGADLSTGEMVQNGESAAMLSCADNA